MYVSKKASKRRLREAQNARANRLEIVKALSTGEVSRRELLRWGIFTAAGTLAHVNGLSPFASSAFANDIPTGAPPSPLWGIQPFTQPMPRLNLQEPIPLTPKARDFELDAAFPDALGELPARRLSYHSEFSASGGSKHANDQPRRGPIEGRPPGDYFAHQRWREYFPKEAYRLSLAPIRSGTRFHPDMPDQGPDKVWTFGTGNAAQSMLPPPLIKMRYGVPVILRHYNNLHYGGDHGGFGSVSQATHNHNAHNASASDGASNSHFFPGQFFDYHWTTTLARSDVINKYAEDERASGPDGNEGLIKVPGDFRELQSTLWFHDHRFFYTAENVYKGHLGMLNYYSGPDRGHERLDDGVNLRLPSGTLLDWGNIDFDVNLMISDAAWDEDGQYFFDIFDTEGFLGDQVLVNFAYKPYFEVLPRKYRFRLLAAGMSRFFQFVLIDGNNSPVPVSVIATDGNLLPRPVEAKLLDQLAVGERFDIVIDFSDFAVGERLRMVNLLEHKDGRGPEELLRLRRALRDDQNDPAVGSFLEFRVVSQVDSVDVPGYTHYADDRDRSRIRRNLTEQIPIVEPVRVREIEFKRSSERDAPSPRDPVTGECFPDCQPLELRETFPWTIRVNGETTHSFNANRISMLIPKPDEVEHWVLRNPSGGWDHPIHLHFEEGITIDRGGRPISKIEHLARKDVWRLGAGGDVRIQVRFGEFGGSYVAHCHNTVHEDAAMIMRFDLYTDPKKNPGSSVKHVAAVPTPNPTPEGVTYVAPEFLPEGNPFDRDFEAFPDVDDGDFRSALGGDIDDVIDD